MLGRSARSARSARALSVGAAGAGVGALATAALLAGGVFGRGAHAPGTASAMRSRHERRMSVSLCWGRCSGMFARRTAAQVPPFPTTPHTSPVPHADGPLPRPRKRLGQHFLSDPRILSRIADALELTGTETVVEIGPGRGALTDVLVERAGRVVAVELDGALAALLRQRYAGNDRVRVV